MRLFTALRPAARARRRHDLRLAPARRGVRDRRPHGRAARRPRRRRAASWPRPRPEETILLIVGREPSQVFRRPARTRWRGAPARWTSFASRTVGPGRLRDPRRRDRRARRACAARARRPSAARCSGCCRPPAGRIVLDGADTLAASPRAGDGGRHQSRLRRPGRRVDHAEPHRAREPVPQSAGGRHGTALLLDRRAARSSAARELGRAGRPAAERSEARRSSSSRAATSRRSWSAAGCIWRARSTSSRIRPPASTSAPRRRSTACSTWRCRRAPRSSSSRPISRRSRRSATARSSSTAAASWRSSRPRTCRSKICSPPRRRTSPGQDGDRSRARLSLWGAPCSPLNPTRSSRRCSELAGLIALAGDGPPAAGLRPADPHAAAHRLLLAAAAGHVPDRT